MLNKFINFFYLSIFLLLLLSACNGNNLNVTPTVSEVTPTLQVESITPTSTLVVEPTQETKSLLILTINSEYFINQSDLNNINTAATNLGYEVVLTDDSSVISDQYSIVITFDQSNQVLNQLNNIQIDHLIIVGEELVDSLLSNFTFIQSSKAEQLFITGYLTALVTDDWRVGGLLPVLNTNNTPASTIFKNGVVYLCGRCTPVYGPIVNFPTTAQLSSPEDTERTMQAFGEISTNRINSLYIPGEYLYDDLVILLKQNKVSIFSDFVPQSEMKDWVDYSITNNLVELVIDILNNPEFDDSTQNSLIVDYRIDSYSDEIPAGRQTFLMEMIDKVQSGLVSPYAVNGE